MDSESTSIAEHLRRLGVRVDRSLSRRYASLADDDPMRWAGDWVSRNEESLLQDLEQLGDAATLIRSSELGAFQTSQGGIWSLFQSYLVVANYLHRNCSIEWRAGMDRETRLDVLCELYAQALLVTEEAGLLIRSGFVVSARARWRTLLELVVFAHVIAFGPRTVANRYIAAQVAEARKSLREGNWSDAFRTSDATEFRAAVLAATRLERQYERVLRKYGPRIRERYGWAEPAIGSNSITWSSLLEFADLPEWLDWAGSYSAASRDVHAGRGGSVQSLAKQQFGSRTHYTPGLQKTFGPTYELLWTIQSFTSLLAGEIYARGLATEPLYWAELCELMAIDITTESFHRNAYVRAGLSFFDYSQPRARERS